MNVFITKSEIAALSWAVKESESLLGLVSDTTDKSQVGQRKLMETRIIRGKSALKKMRYALREAEGDTAVKPQE